MGGVSWAIWAGVGTIIAAGSLLIAWAMLWDRARGRVRCPRCWYDMSSLASRESHEHDPSLTCPECGRAIRQARALTRTRRRWRWAVAGLAVLALVYPVWSAPIIKKRGWVSLLPTWVLVTMPGIDEVEWLATHQPQITNIVVKKKEKSIGTEIDYRLDTMQGSARRHWLGRVARAVNSQPPPSDGKAYARAYEVFDLVEPTREEVEQEPEHQHWCCQSPCELEPSTWAERAASARFDKDQDEWSMADFLMNEKFIGDDLIAPQQWLTGLWCYDTTADGHARVEHALEFLRSGRLETTLPGGRIVRPLDLTGLRHVMDPHDTWRTREDFHRDIVDFITGAVAFDSWIDNGGEEARFLWPRGRILVVAPPEIQSEVDEVLTLLAKPGDCAIEDRSYTLRVGSNRGWYMTKFDVSSYLERMTWCEYEDRRTAEENAWHLLSIITNTVETDFWVDNGGDDARIWSIGASLIVSSRQPIARHVEALLNAVLQENPERARTVSLGGPCSQTSVFDIRDAVTRVYASDEALGVHCGLGEPTELCSHEAESKIESHMEDFLVSEWKGVRCDTVCDWIPPCMVANGRLVVSRRAGCEPLVLAELDRIAIYGLGPEN